MLGPAKQWAELLHVARSDGTGCTLQQGSTGLNHSSPTRTEINPRCTVHHAEEGEHLLASPGFSPFAGAQEPGSESPPFGSPLSNSAAGAERAAQAGTGGVGPSRSLHSFPTAALAAAGGRWAAGDEEERTVHGSSLALGSLERAQQLPRPTTLPRPISTDNLGRVASLAYGIPGVRTRAQVGFGGQGAAGPGPGMDGLMRQQQGNPAC